MVSNFDWKPFFDTFKIVTFAIYNEKKKEYCIALKHNSNHMFFSFTYACFDDRSHENWKRLFFRLPQKAKKNMFIPQNIRTTKRKKNEDRKYGI